MTSDRLPAFLYPANPENLEWAEADGAEDTQAGMPRKTIALIASGGLALLLMIGLVVAALASGDDTTRPTATNKDPGGPVVPVTTQSPTAEPAPTTEAASPTPSPSPSRSKATKTPSPTPAKTTVTPPKATVTSASISLNPRSYEGNCNGGTETTTVTLRITVSMPGTLIRWTVNQQAGKTVVQGTTYTTSWQIHLARKAGSYPQNLNVTDPSSASDSASFTINCKG